MIENIHIIKPHPLQGLIKACYEILPASPVAVGSRPHIVAGLGGDDKLITVSSEMLLKDLSEIPLRAPVFRAVIIRKIEVRDAVIKGCETHLLHIGVVSRISEIMPQSQRQGGKLKPAPAAAVIFHCLVSVVFCLIQCHTSCIFK